MELRHLRYFVAVAEAANFTKAAVQLRVAQFLAFVAERRPSGGGPIRAEWALG